MNQRHQITRAAEYQSLVALRNYIDDACRSYPGVDDQVLYDLKLAVDEACTNIITHGYAGMNPGSIILEIDLSPQVVTLTITDFGHAFEPSEAPKPDLEAGLEDRDTGGFGLYFIYQTMDDVGYECTEDGNHLTLVKRLWSSIPSAEMD